MENKIIQGDCLGIMKEMEDNSIDAVITDPPYGLSFMGKKWDYDVPSVEIWEECLRVLKPGGYLLAFAGTRTQHRMAVRIEDAGFEIRDMIAWVYGCLSEDTEILTEMGYKPLHKTTQYDRIMVYDIQKNIYQWERPQGWQVYRVHEDTAYRIQSDYTDQIVSRNHNCIVEREGKLVFKKAEELSEMEYMPVLSEDFYTLQKGYWKLLLKELLWQSKRLAQTLFGKWEREKATRKGTGDGKKPSVERWSNLFQKERELRKIQNQVCEMSKGISADGEERWICNGTSFNSGSIVGEMFRENPSSASYQSQSRGQQVGEPNVVSIKQGTQDTRVARVTKIKYSGLIFCPTVSTGAFVARRNGKVFITGNSGFPKSLNIGKAVDKLQGNEREKFERDNGSATSIEGKKTIYGSGENKSENGTRRFIDTKGTSEWEGWGTALKPALEPITVARKPLEGHEISNLEEYLDKQGFPSLSKILKKKKLTVAENCLKWGVGGINIDESRVGTDKIEINGGGKKWRKNGKEIEYVEPINEERTGRFPANLIHDGSDEVVSLFPNTKSVRSARGGNKTTEDTSAIRFGSSELDGYECGYNDSGSASRFFYCAKASKSERNRGCEGLEEKDKAGKDFRPNHAVKAELGEDGNPFGRWGKIKNNHPTVKPIALMEYLVKLVSRENAVVLDPFAGSGSTLIACKNLNRQYIGIEREEEYIEIINKRLTTTN